MREPNLHRNNAAEHVMYAVVWLLVLPVRWLDQIRRISHRWGTDERR